MKLAIHSPYGRYSRETGVIYMLANYIRETVPDMVQLKCNGVFSLCDRDEESGWARQIDSCAICMNEQARLAQWAGMPTQDLSPFMTSKDIQESKSWILGLSREELSEAEFNGLNILELCRGSLAARAGEGAIVNAANEDLVRRLMLAALRMCLAVRTFNLNDRPDMIFVAGQKDFLSRSIVRQSQQQGVKAVAFQWDMAARCTHLTDVERGVVFSCPLIMENLSNMRSNYKTWPAEILSLVQEMTCFLGINDNQLSLPLAQ
jgi:hypothetical protein